MSNEEKQIKYLNLTQQEFVDILLKWSKIFFPQTSKDLENKASSARHQIEVASFVGDVLSFYIEDRFKNSNLVTAKDVNSVINLAESLGWKFQGPSAATGIQSFYIEVPAITGSSGNFIPDMRYAFNFKNVQLQNNNGIIFEALDDVDFSSVNISSSLETVVSKRNQTTGQPTYFVLKKNIDVIAGKTVTETFNIGSFKAFKEIEFSTKNVLDIISCKDSDGNDWYEVDYLAQESIFEGIKNLNSDSVDVPFLLKIKTVPRRFVKKVDPKTGKTKIIFGSGKAINVGEPIVPNVADLAINLKGKLTFSPTSIDPQNFLNTRTLGLCPFDTTLTIKLRSGGGKITNTAVNSLTNIISQEIVYNSSELNANDINNTINSFSTRNLSPIDGGDEADNIDIVKNNASAFFAAQNRVNVKEDYIARCLSLPVKFGKIFRVYPVTNCDTNGGVQLYIISKNSNNQLSSATDSLKKNLKNYLSFYTRMGQGIDILDGKIINIGIEYTIVVQPGLNKSKVKFDTLFKVKNMFDINKWQLNQPIILDDIRCLIKDTLGVISISELKIINKSNNIDGQNYSSFSYDIKSNTRNGIIFGIPNGIFEVKYPDSQDIKVAAL